MDQLDQPEQQDQEERLVTVVSQEAKDMTVYMEHQDLLERRDLTADEDPQERLACVDQLVHLERTDVVAKLDHVGLVVSLA